MILKTSSYSLYFPFYFTCFRLLNLICLFSN